MMEKPAEYVLTGERFEDIDCSEAVLNLDYAALPSSVLRLGAWGIVFHLRDHPLPQGLEVDADTLSADVAYLPAWSPMTFTGVSRVDIRVAPYVPSFQGGGVLDRSADGPVELCRTWEVPGQPEPMHTYGFDCVLEHPYGYCSVTIRASGAAILTFRPNLLVPFTVFQADPKKFGWWEVGRLRA